MTAPETFSSKKAALKRKNSQVAQPKCKLTVQQIHDLESNIKLSQYQDLNPIADLVDILADLSSARPVSSSQIIHTTIYALHRIFSTLIRQGRICSAPVSNNAEESVKVVTQWLKQRYNEFVASLLSSLRAPQEESDPLALDGLTILMSLVRSESEFSNSLRQQHATPGERITIPAGGFDSATFKKVVKALLIDTENVSGQDLKPVRKEVKVEFMLRYLNYCDDIRYHFLKEATSICQSYSSASINKQSVLSQSFENPRPETRRLVVDLLYFLEALTTMPTESNELNQFWTGQPSTINSLKRKSKGSSKQAKKAKVVSDGSTGIFDDSPDEDEPVEQSKPSKPHPMLSLRSHQKVFSECWTSFLCLGLAESETKRVLNILHGQVIPHMVDPKILMDFLVDCIDMGGTVAILALNGLFTLISKHNLDYPAFYTRLYALLDRSVLHVRQRPRFMRMLNTFLSSTHLPVNIVASFLKKLARLSLHAPPGAIIAIIPFCYNLIKCHPTCMTMLHRQDAPTSVNSAQDDDPFDFEEPDPLKSGAVFSSLWELGSLKTHYLGSIATLSKVFSEAFDKPNYNLEDFLDHTYKTLFETELNRQIRKAPALSLFASSFKPSAAVESVEPDDIVSQMWKF